MFVLNISVLLEEAEDGNRYTATVKEMPGIHSEASSFPVLFVKLYTDMVSWVRASGQNEAMIKIWGDLAKMKSDEPVRSNIFGPLREDRE